MRDIGFDAPILKVKIDRFGRLSGLWPNPLHKLETLMFERCSVEIARISSAPWNGSHRLHR